jgi:hypothetical protein
MSSISSVSSSSQKALKAAAARFASEPATLVAPAADALTLQSVGALSPTVTAPKKRSLLGTVLWPFTKLGQLITGTFGAIGRGVKGLATSVGNTVAKFFRKPKPVVTPQPVVTVEAPAAPVADAVTPLTK